MKISKILIILILFILMLATTTDGKNKDLHITSPNIKFDKTDAIFTVNYEFDKFSKTYLFIFGTNNIKPKLKDIFPGNYEIVKIDQYKAIFRVKNISRYNDDGYYLHEKYKFNETIDTVYISDPSNNRVRKYYKINSTPSYFYR